jgi:ribonucleoside-diphosphate reductase alpha chain
VLKNNQGTDETRIRQLDYAVVVSSLFWNRLKKGGDITLFDPNQVPELYEAYYRNIDQFDQMYTEYEKRKDLKKKTISAEELFKNQIITERTDTGRIYLMNTDNVQRQGMFDSEINPVYQSNLCCEILIPSVPFQRIEDDAGRIALCTLGSTNWGAFKNPQDMKKACRVLVRSLSNLLSYQEFLSIQSKLSNQEFEPLGIGITNLAYWHAKRGFKYGEPQALAEVKRFMEHQTFYITQMSVELAKERGACTKSADTWYGKGKFVWERRNKNVDELTDFTPTLDWETLRKDMLKYGIRNALLSALPPVESSSVVLNSTNGIELPMALITVKESKAGSFVQVVPEYKRLKNRYQLLWDQTDCIEYLKTAAVLAAFVDQSISVNTFYSPKHFKDGKVPATLIIKNLMLGTRWGLKNFYYSLLDKAGAKRNLEETQNLQPVTVVEPDSDQPCESCVL